jgi:hypothetical protein
MLLFPLDLDYLIFILGYSFLGMEFWVKPPTFGLPVSIQSAILTLVHACVSSPSRVPTIPILMTPFLAKKTNQIYYGIPFLFVMIFAILFVWSPKSWSRYGW